MAFSPFIPSLALALGPIMFGVPVLAWGLIGALTPILLHLLLRRRPRPVIFPAVRLLLMYRSAETRAQRLRYFVLLTLRTLLIVLLVVILMRVGCRAAGGVGGGATVARGPVSAVLCIDDSASMGYRFRGEARLRHAAAMARDLLADESRFPLGSEVAVVTAGLGPESVPLTTGLSAVGRRLDGLRPGSHDGTVAAALGRAYLLLVGAHNQRKEVYLFTDLAAHAWHRELPKPPDDLVAVTIVDVGGAENDNSCLAWPTVPEQPLPVDTPFEVSTLVRGGDRPVDGSIEVTIDGQTRGRQAVGRIAADGHREAAVSISALPRGSHAITLTLLPPDALDADNGRFLWVEVEDRDRVIVVADEPAGDVAAMIEAMVAPSALHAIEQRFEARRLATAAVQPSTLAGAKAVMLADPGTIPAPVWDALAEYTKAGGLVTIVPGPQTTAETFTVGKNVLPAPVTSIEACPEPLTVAAANLSHPWLKPFADTAVDTINDRSVYRRLRVGALASDSTVVAPFSDGKPAILTRLIGRGQVVLLAFSPARQWSQLGSQAGPMIVFVQTLLADRGRPATRVDTLAAGRAESRWFDVAGDDGLLLTGLGQDTSIRLPTRSGLARLPTEVPGTYRIARAASPPRDLLHYAVNVAESESEATRISPEAAITLFPPGRARVLGTGDLAGGGSGMGRQAVSWVVPAVLMLLTLLVIESAFANRFYSLFAPRSDSRNPHF